MQVLQKINKYISQILKVALIACFTYMTVVLSLQVFGRYLFHKGFSWTEETARYIMIWAVFLGAAYIALNLEHVKVSIIEDLMKKQKHKQILELVQHIAGFIFVVIVLKYGFMQMTIAKPLFLSSNPPEAFSPLAESDSPLFTNLQSPNASLYLYHVAPL